MVSVGGRSFRTVQAGEGATTVVFEAGLSASASEWVMVQRELAAHTATLSYDRAGYSGSAPSGEDRTLVNLAADLERVLVAAQVTGPVVLVGHSWGCPIIREFLTTTQRAVAGVVLVDGTVSAVMTAKEANLAARMFGLMGKISRLGLQKPMLNKLLSAAKGDLSDADATIVLRDMTSGNSVRTAAREAAALRNERLALPVLESTDFPAGVPVTFLMGALPDKGQIEMRKTFVAAAEQEAERRGERFVLATGSSHFVPQQEPGVVSAEILRYVGK